MCGCLPAKLILRSRAVEKPASETRVKLFYSFILGTSARRIRPLAANFVATTRTLLADVYN